jgi:hypothetical protein
MSVSNFDINYNTGDENDEKIFNNYNDYNDYNDYNETYSLRIITDWLKQKNITYKYNNGGTFGLEMYNHGINVKLHKTFENTENTENTEKITELSIQTNHIIAGWAFAETLLRSDILSDTRHATPEDLFNYIVSFL